MEILCFTGMNFEWANGLPIECSEKHIFVNEHLENVRLKAEKPLENQTYFMVPSNPFGTHFLSMVK